MSRKCTFLFLLLLVACIPQLSSSSDAAEISSLEVNEGSLINQHRNSLMSSLNNIASAHKDNGITTGEAVAIVVSIVSLGFTGMATWMLLEQRTLETIRYCLERYSSAEMLTALVDIRSVDVEAWGEKRLTPEEHRRIDQSRRHLKFFYLQAYTLRKSKLMTKKCFKIICELKGVELYITKIKEMDSHRDESALIDSYEYYEKFCKRNKINYTLTPISQKKS